MEVNVVDLKLCLLVCIVSFLYFVLGKRYVLFNCEFVYIRCFGFCCFVDICFLESCYVDFEVCGEIDRVFLYVCVGFYVLSVFKLDCCLKRVMVIFSMLSLVFVMINGIV